MSSEGRGRFHPLYLVRAGNSHNPSTISDTKNVFSAVAPFSLVRDAVVCSLTSVAIEWAYFEDFLHARSHFIMGRGDNRDDADREQRDLHSAAINGILSGLVSITAGEVGVAVTDLLSAPFRFPPKTRLDCEGNETFGVPAKCRSFSTTPPHQDSPRVQLFMRFPRSFQNNCCAVWV